MGPNRNCVSQSNFLLFLTKAEDKFRCKLFQQFLQHRDVESYLGEFHLSSVVVSILKGTGPYESAIQNCSRIHFLCTHLDMLTLSTWPQMQTIGLCLNFHLSVLVPWMECIKMTLSLVLDSGFLPTIMTNPTFPPWLMIGPRNLAQLRGQVSHCLLPSTPDYLNIQGHSASERQSQDSNYSFYYFILPPRLTIKVNR